MKRLTTILVATMFLVVLGAGSAVAYPVNVRPDTSLTNLGALQTFLNSEGQSIDVYADQADAAFWQTTVSENSQFTIMLEQAGWAGTNKFGIYNYGDTGTLFQIFDGASSVGYHAIVTFNADGVAGKMVSTLMNGSTIVGQQTYLGVDSSAFGFYLDSTGANTNNSGVMFSYDGDNTGGYAQYLAYLGTGASAGNWWICFEDQARWISSDSDFTDFVIFAESINPVTEPMTMLLLGFGLLGLGFVRRKN